MESWVWWRAGCNGELLGARFDGDPLRAVCDGELLRAECDKELLRAGCGGELLGAGCDGELGVILSLIIYSGTVLVAQRYRELIIQ